MYTVVVHTTNALQARLRAIFVPYRGGRKDLVSLYGAVRILPPSTSKLAPYQSERNLISSRKRISLHRLFDCSAGCVLSYCVLDLATRLCRLRTFVGVVSDIYTNVTQKCGPYKALLSVPSHSPLEQQLWGKASRHSCVRFARDHLDPPRATTQNGARLS